MAVKQKRVRLIPDHDPIDIREECDNFGTFVNFDSRSCMGDENPTKQSPEEYLFELAIEACPRLEEIVEYWENEGYEWFIDELGYSRERALKTVSEHVSNLTEWVLERSFIMLPVYKYEHSGVMISTSPFSCPWDSGQVGFIYVSISDVNEEMGGDKELAKKQLETEIKAFSQYLEGDVYGFVVEEYDEESDEWDEVDSCWGFYGSDVKENGMLDHVSDEDKRLFEKAEIDYSY